MKQCLGTFEDKLVYGSLVHYRCQYCVHMEKGFQDSSIRADVIFIYIISSPP